MKSDIISAVHNLRRADEHMQSLIRDRPRSVMAKLFRSYSKKIEWMLQDMKSDPQLPHIVSAGINQEINSDVFTVPALQEKIPLLTPAKREMVELIVDRLLADEEIEVQMK